MNFCMRCGAALAPGARFCTGCGNAVQAGGGAPPAVAGPAYQAQYSGQAPNVYPTGLPAPGAPVLGRGVPPQIWLVVAMLVVSAGFILEPSIRLIADAASSLGDKGFEAAFALLFVVLALIVASFGVALLAVAWLLVRGDRVGRALTFALTAAVVLGEVLAKPHSTSDYVVIAVCIAVDVVLAIPNANAFFRARDDRPTGVVAAVVLIGFFAWDFALFGTALLPQYHYEHKDLPLGIGMLATSVALLALNHNLSRGRQWARVTATALLGVVAVLALVAEHRALSAVILAVLAGATIGLMWGSTAANAYFAAGGAAWTRRAWGPAQIAISALAAVCLIGVGVIGVRANQTPDFSAAAYDDTYTAPDPAYVPPANPAPANDVSGYTYSWTFDESSDGEDGSATLEVGDPEQYQDGISSGDDTLGACDYEVDYPSQAAAIPFRLELDNDVDSESDATFGLDLQGLGDNSIPGISGPLMYVDAAYHDGAECDGDNGEEDFATISTDPISPGDDAVTYGFFVITDYYGTDSTPQDVLNDSSLTVSPTESFENDAIDVDVNSASGPGLTDNYDGGWTFTLAGASAE